MKVLQSLSRHLGTLWDDTTGFDYVDRLIVFLYLTVSLMAFIFTLSQHLTDAEAAEIAPAFDTLFYVLLFFLAWPVIRVAIQRGSQRLARYVNSRGESA